MAKTFLRSNHNQLLRTCRLHWENLHYWAFRWSRHQCSLWTEHCTPTPKSTPKIPNHIPGISRYTRILLVMRNRELRLCILSAEHRFTCKTSSCMVCTPEILYQHLSQTSGEIFTYFVFNCLSGSGLKFPHWTDSKTCNRTALNPKVSDLWITKASLFITKHCSFNAQHLV